MLANRRVGTKLATILAAPLLVLGVVAGVGIVERLDRAGVARDAERQAELAARNARFVHDLEVEQLWAAVTVATGTAEGTEQFEASVAASSTTLADLRRAIDGLGRTSPAFDDRLATVEDRLEPLAQARADIRAGTARFDETRAVYGQLLSALVGLFGAAADEQLPEIAPELANASAMARGKNARAVAASDLAAVSAGGTGPAAERYRADAEAFLARSERYFEQFFEESTTPLRALLRDAQAGEAAREADELMGTVLAGGQIPPVALAEATERRLLDELAVQDRLAEVIFIEADSARRDAVGTARLYIAGAVAGIVAAAAIAFVVARSITRPLRRLTEATRTLSDQTLPALVEGLRNPTAAAEDAPPIPLTPIEVRSGDEIGELARAFDSLQRVTVDVAAEQSALLRKGISDIFVNLARRNQTLLDRQIEFIDTLEANERDPDQLENLFKLDHLATRMRRNAESLLVLAGAEPGRRRGRPVPLADVVRVAIGEVADYARINLLALDDVAVGPGVAVDLAHLLAELMDNATQFSPPEVAVEVVGHRTRHDGYVLSVSDHGIGMPVDQMTQANELLARPPVAGLNIGRSLGFVVIGRLALRHGLEVRLTPSPAGGVTALVTLPADLLAPTDPDDVRPAGDRPPPALEDRAPAPTPRAATFDPVPALPTRAGVTVASHERPAEAPERGGEAAGAEAGDGGAASGHVNGHADRRVPVDASPAPSEADPAPREAPAAEPAAASEGRPATRTFTYHDVEDLRLGAGDLVPGPGDRLESPDSPPGTADAGGPTGDDALEPAEPSPLPLPGPAEPSPLPLPGPAASDEAEPEAAQEPSDEPPAAGGLELAAAESPRDDGGPPSRGLLATPQYTAAGLIRRSPKQQLRSFGEGSDSPRITSNQRSPEEVRRMLSRYRTGLQRGRAAGSESASGTPGGAPDQDRTAARGELTAPVPGADESNPLSEDQAWRT